MIKHTAASFLLMAGLLFLGHAVVPHHHHGNLICFIKSHCTGEEPAGDHGSSPDNHHHDGEDGDGHCVLKDPVVVSSNQLTAGLKLIDKKCSQPWGENLFVGLQANETGSPGTKLLYSLSAPPAIFLYSSLSSHSSGLRAPPTV